MEAADRCGKVSLSSMASTKTIPCTTCGKPTEYFVEPLGPFCSSRCQMVDLGKWMGEEYRVSEPLRPDHFAEFEQLDGGEELDRPKD
jgi:endogenous inhibitor of DNA gyrase (YacG/DUF329 family)